MYSLKLTLADINQLINNEIEYEISLTEQELKAVPNVQSVNELFAYFTAYESDNGYLVSVEIEGSINILDHATTKYTKLKISEREDVIVSEDETLTDIKVERGECEFYPAVLALFYSSVPIRYASKKIDYDKKEDYTLMSEETYNKKMKKPKKEEAAENPFAALDPDEFE
jgi:hypothetical protein